MKTVAFLSMDDLGSYVSDDQLAVPFLRELGLEVEEVPWRAEENWGRFEAVIVRTTWDYQADLPAFLTALQGIESQTLLLNSYAICSWNADKTYLRDLSDRGVPSVPTLWRDRLAPGDDLFELGPEVVVKPTISASAEGTFRLRSGDDLTEVWTVFENRPAMIQPFLPSIVEEGEFSLFYFNGDFSHAIIKQPKRGDFRVQEIHGGQIPPFEVTPELTEIGRLVIDAVDERLLYARVDLVRLPDGRLGLMELELIEPALFLRKDHGAPERFARAIRERVG